jgi:hypothetical protein
MSIHELSILFLLLLLGCTSASRTEEATTPDSTTRTYEHKLIDFTPYAENPVFSGTDTNTWDQHGWSSLIGILNIKVKSIKAGFRHLARCLA